MPYYQRNLHILATTIFLAALSWNQVIPFLPLFMKQMGIPQGELLRWVGIIYALQAAASIVCTPFWGKIADHYGRKPMTVRAGFCLAAIYLGMSICQTPLQLAVLRFLNGALTGFIPSSIALIATNTPRNKAARAIAVVQTTSALGLIIGPAAGGFLASVAGYRGSMQVSGAAVLLSTLLVWWLVKEPHKPEIAEPTTLLQDFVVSMRSRVLGSVLMIGAVAGIVGGAVSPILVLHLSGLDGGVSVATTGIVLSLPPLALLMTTLLWTKLGESRGHHLAIRVGMTGGGLALLALACSRDIYLFSAIYFISGALLASATPCSAAIILHKVPISFRGRAYGMQQSAAMLGALVGPIAASYIGGRLGLASVFVFTGVVTIAGTLAFAAIAAHWVHWTEEQAAAEFPA